jgi:hypothetical protein
VTDYHQIHKFHDVDEFGMWVAYSLVHPTSCMSLIPMLVTDPSTGKNAIDLATGEEVCEYREAFDCEGSLDDILAQLADADNGLYPFELESIVILADGSVTKFWRLI